MDQTAMLIAAVATLWGGCIALLRFTWILISRMLDEKNGEIRDLKAEARATLQAKDEEIKELKEWRRRAYMAGHPQAVTPGGE